MNLEGLVTNSLNKSCVEHIALINVSVRATRGDWCPLIAFVWSYKRKYPCLQTMRIKGEIKERSIYTFLLAMLWDSYPVGTYFSMHTTLPAGHIDVKSTITEILAHQRNKDRWLTLVKSK